MSVNPPISTPSNSPMPSKRCGAKCRDGHPCTQWAMPNGRCKMHGGKSLQGPAHPHYKGGRYAEFLRGSLKGKYEESRRDPNLIALSDELNLVDAMTADALERAQTGETDGAWIELRKLWNARLGALQAKDSAKLAEITETIGRVIFRSAEAADVRAQVLGLIERRRKLSESELKRLVAAKQVMTIEQAVVLMDKIIILITENVHDRRALSAILTGFSAIFHAQGGDEAYLSAGGPGQLN